MRIAMGIHSNKKPDCPSTGTFNYCLPYTVCTAIDSLYSTVQYFSSALLYSVHVYNTVLHFRINQNEVKKR